MWPRGHTCIHTPVFWFSFLKLTMTEEQAPPLPWLDSHLSSWFNPHWNLGEERPMNSSHKAGFLPPIHPQPYWLCSLAVNWAPYAKAGWPRPSWLWEQTCPQRICNQEVGISACSSPGSTGKCHASFPWYRICESLKSIIYKTRPLRSILYVSKAGY